MTRVLECARQLIMFHLMHIILLHHSFRVDNSMPLMILTKKTREEISLCTSVPPSSKPSSEPSLPWEKWQLTLEVPSFHSRPRL